VPEYRTPEFGGGGCRGPSFRASEFDGGGDAPFVARLTESGGEDGARLVFKPDSVGGGVILGSSCVWKVGARWIRSLAHDSAVPES